MSRAKWKTTLLILLCICVLILGAALPGMLGNIHEKNYQPGYAAMHSVELQLRGEASLKEMLSVISNSTNTLEVSGDMATRTEQEILDLVEERLQPYLDAGLILAPGLDVHSQTYSCKPYLTVSEGETAASVLCWQVLILHDEEEPALVVGIDDQTGALVLLDFHSSKTEFYNGGNYFVPDKTIRTMYDIYLAGLGEEFAEHDASMEKSYPAWNGENAQHWSIRWETDYGPAGIGFDAWPYGVTIGLF